MAVTIVPVIELLELQTIREETLRISHLLEQLRTTELAVKWLARRHLLKNSSGKYDSASNAAGAFGGERITCCKRPYTKHVLVTLTGTNYLIIIRFIGKVGLYV